MTPDQQRDALEVFDISERAYWDAVELLQLVEVLQGQNKDPVNTNLSSSDAGNAGTVVRNSVLSRIVLFVAGAYAPARPGDLHLQRAFDLLEQPAVRQELESRGSPQLLTQATQLWAECKNDSRLETIKHFRNKFTAHSSKPDEKIPIPMYHEVFGFTQDTTTLMDTFASGTGAQPEPLANWQEQASKSAARFWKAWG